MGLCPRMGLLSHCMFGGGGLLLVGVWVGGVRCVGHGHGGSVGIRTLGGGVVFFTLGGVGASLPNSRHVASLQVGPSWPSMRPARRSDIRASMPVVGFTTVLAK